jgi:alkanesulfonate monooxygenase SsuD/methylene tetrahydromethanopterin reductase-like flavin-dependent oxidoreductase (luciferase family)
MLTARRGQFRGRAPGYRRGDPSNTSNRLEKTCGQARTPHGDSLTDRHSRRGPPGTARDHRWRGHVTSAGGASAPVRVGVLLPAHAANPGAVLGDIGRAARHAEDVGLDGVWAGDHLTTGHPLVESTVALACAAAVTTRVTVGYGVMLLGLRHPAWAAKQIASLQYVSGNRLLLGVGLGGVGSPNEWEAAGVPSRGRGRRTDLMLAALPGLLSGRPTVLESEPGRPTVALQPPVPLPEIWIGGASDAALSRAVAYGQGWLAVLQSPDQLAREATRLRALAEARGRPTPALGLVVFAALTERAARDPAAPVAGFLTSAYGLSTAQAAAVSVGGAPEQAAERLSGYLAAGVSTLMVVPLGADVLTQYDLLAQSRSILLSQR